MEVSRQHGMIFAAAVAVIVLSPVLNWLINPGQADDEIQYRGQTFKLTKAYGDYDDYKDDPNNLAPGQEAKIEQAMTSAFIRPKYSTRQELVQDAFDLAFPGYGTIQFGNTPTADGTTLAAFGFEIPRASKARIVVYRGPANSPFNLIADFVQPGGAVAATVSEAKGVLTFTRVDGATAFTHKLQ